MRRTPNTYPSLLERSKQQVRSLSPVQNGCLSAPTRLVFLSATARAAERLQRAVARISCLVVNLAWRRGCERPVSFAGSCINAAPFWSPIQFARKVASGDSTRMASGSLFASSLRMMVCAPAYFPL